MDDEGITIKRLPEATDDLYVFVDGDTVVLENTDYDLGWRTRLTFPAARQLAEYFMRVTAAREHERTE